jgi:5'-nucleotidase
MPRPKGPALLFNLNVPAGSVKGLRATKLGTRLWTETVDARIDPRGRAYYWLGGSGVQHDLVPGSDTEAHDAGLASLSVLGLDLARHDDQATETVNKIVSAIRT